MAPAPGPPSLLGNCPCQSYAALLCSPGFPDRSGNSSAVSFLGHPWHRQNQMIGIAIHPFFISGNGWKWNDFWEWNTLANLVPSFPSPSHLRNMLDKNCDEMKSMRFCCSCLFKYVCVLETVTPSRGWRLYIYVYVCNILKFSTKQEITGLLSHGDMNDQDAIAINCEQQRGTNLKIGGSSAICWLQTIVKVLVNPELPVYIYIYTRVCIYISLSL